MRFSALIVFAAVVCSLGHNWLESPDSRGGNNPAGSTQNPCDSGVYAAGTSQFTKFVGDSIALDFSQNHDTPNADQYIKIATYSTGDTGLATPVFTASWPRTGADGTGTNTATITTPNNPGLNTMQWSWSGYYNCVDFTILARPPTDSEEADEEDVPEAFEDDAQYVYVTADGHGYFNAWTGEMLCDEGYVEYYDDESGDLAGCLKVNAGEGVIYVSFELNLGPDNWDEADFTEEAFAAAIANALDVDESQVAVTHFEQGEGEVSYVTVALYDGEDGTAVELYTEFSSQYRDESSPLNQDSLTAWINTDIALETDDEDPYSAASTLTITVAAGVVVAGVML